MLDMKGLEALGMDTEEGLAYCAEDPEFYEEMIAEFVQEAPQRQAELQRSLAASDWDAYRIQAHSVKSTSRMIGAQALSQRAEALEAAAKVGDAAAIADGHGEFDDAYRTLVDGLREALA